MYENKLREFFEKNKSLAEQELDRGNNDAAASYYERCADVLLQQASNRRGPDREKKEELAEKYYEIAENLSGQSDSLKKKRKVSSGGKQEEDENDFSEYVDRFLQKSDVTWKDVAGLEETKKDIKESFALSTIENKPPAIDTISSVLLYGPPGTGKTLLASAVAGSHDFPFFNVQLSHALSKYYGESGKIISSIFDAAREKSPSVVFFDELDSVAMSRGGDLDESSRRVLSTLLTELSGFGEDDKDIMFMGATNTPWDMDPAVLSRVEKVVYVPLPDEITARKILELNTVEKGVDVSEDMEKLAERCVEKNYSGREIKNFAKTAIREMVADMNPGLDSLAEKSMDKVKDYELKLRPLEMADFDRAFGMVESKTDMKDVKRYEEWGEKFGK